jgi:hypothetical protein
MHNPIPVNTPLLSGNELKYVTECIETGWISSEGPFISRFEEAFASYIGSKHGIAVSNGTAALDIAVAALGIGPGDEVIMPTFTIISPALQVVRSGAKPVLVDSDPLTWNMDVAQIEAKITPKTKAIIVVHIYGFHVKESNAYEALDCAKTGYIKEGNVGGGTGMMCLGFKGGTGTSSRVVRIKDSNYTVGVLVQSNFGSKRNLTIAGVPIGKELKDTMNYEIKAPPAYRDEGSGSIIVVVATVVVVVVGAALVIVTAAILAAVIADMVLMKLLQW